MDILEKAMNIVGIYGWGTGITIENDNKFKDIISDKKYISYLIILILIEIFVLILYCKDFNVFLY